MASSQMQRIHTTKRRLNILKDALKDHGQEKYDLTEIIALAIEISDYEEVFQFASKADFNDLWRTVAGIKAVILWDSSRLVPLIESLITFIIRNKCAWEPKKEDKQSFSTIFIAAMPLAIFEAYNTIKHEMTAEMRQRSKEIIVEFIEALGLMPDYARGYRGSITDYVGVKNHSKYTSRLSSAAKLFFMCEPELSKQVISAVQIDPPTNCIAEDIVSQIVYAVLSPLKCNMHVLAANAVLTYQSEAAPQKSILERVRFEDEINP